MINFNVCYMDTIHYFWLIETVIKHQIICKTVQVIFIIVINISAASFQRNRCEGKILNFPCISNPN